MPVDKKISEQTAATNLTGAEFAGFQSGVTKRFPASLVAQRTIGFAFDAGGGVLDEATSPTVYFPYAGTITKMTLLADQAGGASVSIWADTYANHPPTVADEITSLTLTAQSKNQSGALSIAVAAGTALRCKLSSPTTITQLSVALELILT